MTSVRKRIKPGDLVMVCYPLNDSTNNPAKKFDGEQMVVKRKKTFAVRPMGRSYYELYGAVSDKGVPYGFLDDELILL